MHKTLRLTLFIIIGTIIAGFWGGASASAARVSAPLTPADVRLSAFDSFKPSLKQYQYNHRGFSCLGAPATDIVLSGDDWTGTDRDEVVLVLGSGGVISAQGGHDKICIYNSSHGFSYIFGGAGNDTVITYNGGNHRVDVGEGNNLVYLNGGGDVNVMAGGGTDHIWALGVDKVTASGGPGNDLIVGSPGDDSLNAGSGDDIVLGNNGNDEIIGLFGNNQLYGGNGQDTIDGGADHDLCHDFDQNTIFTHCEDIIQPPGPPLPESG